MRTYMRCALIKFGEDWSNTRHYLHLNDLFFGRTCQNTLLPV